MNTNKATFFSSTKDADVHLHAIPEINIGKVWSDDETIFVGSAEKARDVFYNLHAQEETFYAVLRAKFRSLIDTLPDQGATA